MTTETHQQAAAIVYKDITPKRRSRLPLWLADRLRAVVDEIEDLLINRVKLESDVRDMEGKLQEAQAQVANLLDEVSTLKASLRQVQLRSLGAPKSPAEPDYVMRDPKEGRYKYDLMAELTVLPGERKPYRVTVWEWAYSYTHQKWGWYPYLPGIGKDEFKPQRDFKTAWDAAEYVGKVRGHADGALIVKRAEDAHQAARTRIA